MNPFIKQKEKIGFAMHIFGAKKYARRNKRIAKKIKKSIDNQKNLVNDIDLVIKERSIKRITDTTIAFIKECTNELRLLDSVQENVFTIEYKMIKELKSIINDLGELKNTKAEGAGALIDTTSQQGLTTLHSLFDKIHDKAVSERKQVKRVKSGTIGFKEIGAEQLPDALEFHSLKSSSKKESKEIKKVDKVLGDLHKVIKEIYQGEGNNENIEKIKSDIIELKTDIEHELIFLSKALKVISVFMKRLRDLNNNTFTKVISLIEIGFPKKASGMIETEQNDFKNLILKLEREEVRRTKVLVGDTWGKTL